MTEIPVAYGNRGGRQSQPCSASRDAIASNGCGRTQEEQLARLAELAPVVDAGLMVRIARAILRAEREHPVFAVDFAGAVNQVKSELLEWESKAIVGRRDDAEAEAFDGIAVLARFVRRDYEGGGK